MLFVYLLSGSAVYSFIGEGYKASPLRCFAVGVSIWVLLGGIALAVISLGLGIDVSQANLISQEAQQITNSTVVINEAFIAFSKLPLLQLVFFFFLYFTGGYFLYSAIYVAIGAAVDSETDTQQFMLPIIVPLILAIYIGFSL